MSFDFLFVLPCTLLSTKIARFCVLFATSRAKFLPNCFFFLEKRHFVSHSLQSEGINCDIESKLRFLV